MNSRRRDDVDRSEPNLDPFMFDDERQDNSYSRPVLSHTGPGRAWPQAPDTGVCFREGPQNAHQDDFRAAGPYSGGYNFPNVRRERSVALPVSVGNLVNGPFAVHVTDANGSSAWTGGWCQPAGAASSKSMVTSAGLGGDTVGLRENDARMEAELNHLAPQGRTVQPPSPSIHPARVWPWSPQHPRSGTWDNEGRVQIAQNDNRHNRRSRDTPSIIEVENEGFMMLTEEHPRRQAHQEPSAYLVMTAPRVDTRQEYLRDQQHFIRLVDGSRDQSASRQYQNPPAISLHFEANTRSRLDESDAGSTCWPESLLNNISGGGSSTDSSSGFVPTADGSISSTPPGYQSSDLSEMTEYLLGKCSNDTDDVAPVSESMGASELTIMPDDRLPKLMSLTDDDDTPDGSYDVLYFSESPSENSQNDFEHIPQVDGIHDDIDSTSSNLSMNSGFGRSPTADHRVYLTVQGSPAGGLDDPLPHSATVADYPDPLQCPENGCTQSFKGEYRRGNRARHRRLVHRGTEFLCEDISCARPFKRKDARLKHYRNHHPHLCANSPYLPRKARSVGPADKSCGPR